MLLTLLLALAACDSKESTDTGLRDLDGDGDPETTDCDDHDEDINHDAVEVRYDGVDQDCDDADLVDVDGDGFAAEQVGGDDCNDDDATLNPGAEEVQGDGIDQDCDGLDGEVVGDDTGGSGDSVKGGGEESCGCSTQGEAALPLLGLLGLLGLRRRR